MAFRCPHCGGNAVFSADLQMMKCEYCESVFSPEQFAVRDESRQTDIPAAGLTLFTCRGCGAELQGTEESQVGFCPYCGGQSVLRTGPGEENRTEYVLPFRISREKCAELYREHAKKVRCLPKELKNPAHLENFTGIYMPYYQYDVQMGQSYIEGTKTVESRARYDVVNTYRIDASVAGDYCGVTFDASRYLDDELAARVLPYDMGEERPFEPSYLSGFYADASTVPPETYYDDAAKQAAKDVVDEVAERIYAQDGIRVDKQTSHIEARTRGYHSSLLPMWFLTWRKGDRVAYAVVNGQSGKVVSDLPVDMKAFAGGCAVIAAILFAVLELLFQPTPVLTSVLSLVAGVLMALSVRNSTKRIYEKQTHANDKGWGQGSPAAVPAGKKKKFPLWILALLGFYAAYYFLSVSSEGMPLILAAAAVVFLAAETFKVMGWQKSIPEKHPSLAILLILAGVIVNAAIIVLSPVNDMWYYLGDAAGILVLILAAVSMTRVYNIGTMRPLPKLFGRNEVG